MLEHEVIARYNTYTHVWNGSHGVSLVFLLLLGLVDQSRSYVSGVSFLFLFICPLVC